MSTSAFKYIDELKHRTAAVSDAPEQQVIYIRVFLFMNGFFTVERRGGPGLLMILAQPCRERGWNNDQTRDAR